MVSSARTAKEKAEEEGRKKDFFRSFFWAPGKGRESWEVEEEGWKEGSEFSSRSLLSWRQLGLEGGEGEWEGGSPLL